MLRGFWVRDLIHKLFMLRTQPVTQTFQVKLPFNVASSLSPFTKAALIFPVFSNTTYLFEDDVNVSCNQLGYLLPLCGLY